MEKSIYLKQIDNESKHWWFKARREILNKQIEKYSTKKKMSILDFPRMVREDFNIEAAEYWNVPLIEKRKDPNFIKEIINKTNDYGLKNTIMLVDLYNLQTNPGTRQFSLEITNFV